MVAGAWPGHAHAVVSLPDKHKGEQLVLVTEYAEAERSALQQRAKTVGVTEINVPKKLLKVKKLPVLGTGKIDYHGVAALAQQEFLNQEDAT